MPYLLFDCDGTLLDSMEMWESLSFRVLKSHGVDLPIEEDRNTASMSHRTACQYYADKYFQGQKADVLLDEFNRVLEDNYGHHLQLKDHVRDILDSLYAAKIPMAIASSTDERLLRMAFERLDMLKYFQFIQSVDNAGHSKDSDAYYHLAAERFGTSLDNMLFFDDALYALKRASQVGLPTVAVADPSNEDHRDLIKAVADYYINDFSELPLAKLIVDSSIKKPLS